MIRSLFYFITHNFVFKNINKNIFKFVLNNLKTVLMGLPLTKIWNLFLDLV
jgi:hypothetical protein